MNANLQPNAMLRPPLAGPQRQAMPAAMGMLPNASIPDPGQLYQVQLNQAMNQASGPHRQPQLGVRNVTPNVQNVANVGVNMNQHMLAQGMPFVGHPQQQQMRRVPSNQPGPHFNQHMGMPMNSSNPNMQNVPFRQHPGQHMGPQMHRNVNPMQGIPPEMQMSAMRQTGAPPHNQPPGMGNGVGMAALPANMSGIPNNRPPTAQQLMSGLNQPAMGPHLQNTVNANFSTAQPPQMTQSPRPGSSHMQIPAPSQTPISRTRMTPDQQQQALFSNGSSFQGGTPRIAPSNASFTFPPAASPNPLGNPQGVGDVTHSLGPPFNPAGTPGGIGVSSGVAPGRVAPGRTSSRAEFHPTPAQQLEQMQNNGEGYSVGSFPIPQRPPSQHHTPHTQHNTPQMSHSSPFHHSSPQQNPQQQMHNPSNPQMQPPPQRPQSQPQGRPPSQAGLHSGTPNPNSTNNPMTPQNSMQNSQAMMPPGGRISRQQQHPGQISQAGNSMQPLGQQGQPPNQPLGSVQLPGASLPIAPRPPMAPGTQSNTVVGPRTNENSQIIVPRQAPVPPVVQPPVGNGQGLIRLLQFSGVLASSENFDKKLQLSWWKDLIKEYFSPRAVMKFTLWKDNQRQEAKPFEIGTPILPRFFLVTAQSGVKSMTLSLDGARERLYSTGHSVVECVTAVWTYRYNNGYTVTLRGPLTAHVVITSTSPPGSLGNSIASPPSGTAPSAGGTFAAPGAGGSSAPQLQLKFEDFQFDALYHDKYVVLDQIMGVRGPLEAPQPGDGGPPMPNGQYHQSHGQGTDRSDEQRWPIEHGSIPAEPVNAFGVPQATMRCLELAESVGQMADLITFTTETGLGPLDALKQYATNLREKGLVAPPPVGVPPFTNGIPGAQPYHPFPPTTNGLGQHGSTPLYPNASFSNIVPNPQPAAVVNSPQTTPTSASNSPQKQHKTIPQQPQQASAPGSATVSTPASVATPGTSSTTGGSTPSLANATLKRKQGSETASPTTSNAEQPPAKRTARKRKATAS